MARFRAMPYAKALHDVVSSQDPGQVEAIGDELVRVAAAVASVPELIRVLVAPVLPTQAKVEIFTAILDALELSDPTRRLLLVVQQHYRLEHLNQIAEVYGELVDRALGRTRATVELAAEVSAAERERVTATLAAVLKRSVVADFKVSPELLAGFRIQVGSRVFDGSLDGQLDRLSQQTQI
jgi:F-type H+-transporting ATPase subunit delta